MVFLLMISSLPFKAPFLAVTMESLFEGVTTRASTEEKTGFKWCDLQSVDYKQALVEHFGTHKEE